MGQMTDIESTLDDLEIVYWETNYSGGSKSSSSIDLDALELPRSGALLLSTQNGSNGDVVDIDIQDSADDSNWSDFDTGAPTLDDATAEATYVIDLDAARRYIRADFASGDQTVSSSDVDVVVALAAVGSQQTQTL